MKRQTLKTIVNIFVLGLPVGCIVAGSRMLAIGASYGFVEWVVRSLLGGILLSLFFVALYAIFLAIERFTK